MFGAHSGTETGFSVCPTQYNCAIFPYSSLHLPPALYSYQQTAFTNNSSKINYQEDSTVKNTDCWPPCKAYRIGLLYQQDFFFQIVNIRYVPFPPEVCKASLLTVFLTHFSCPCFRISYACILTYLLTYLLTPWCRVLLEKLTGLQLVMKFPAFHGTRRFITALISFRHLSLHRASPIQSLYPHPTSSRSILILSTHLILGLTSGLLPSSFPTKILYAPLSSPIRATCPAHLILLDFITRTILGEQYKSFSSSLCNLLHSPVTSSLLGPNILKELHL